jgi:TM2 domain-containing membrane protein YozV
MNEYFNILHYLPIQEISFVLPGVGFIIVGIGLYKLSKKQSVQLSLNEAHENISKKFMRGFSKFIICFAVIFTITSGLSIFIRYFNLRQCYINKNYNIVKGVVENFNPMPYTGHKLESFTIDGILFEYSDYDLSTGGFRRTKSHGGPIDEGVYIKIYYVSIKGVGNSIISLWKK